MTDSPIALSFMRRFSRFTMGAHTLVLAVVGMWLAAVPATRAFAQSSGVLLARGSTDQPAFAAGPGVQPRVPDAARQVETYAEIAYRTYRDAHAGVLALGRAVDRLLRTPNANTLAAARRAWLAARPSYGQSEVFRFYGGPIDAGKQDDFGAGAAGLEGLINAWPLNESYIDEVIAGHEWITKNLLIRKNAHDDEADVTTGYHAIEYLLWGRDTRAEGPGDRKASDFVGEGAAARRRTYLKIATDLLTQQLATLVEAWAPDKDNYRALMQRQQSSTALRNMLVGMASLSGFELASERLATALDSGSQEDEQSCFSDSTHIDILANVLGIQNVYLGRYGSYQGASLHTLVQSANRDLSRYLQARIALTVQLARGIDRPIDRTLATPPGSPSRAKLEALVQALQVQTDLLKQASSALAVPISLGDND